MIFGAITNSWRMQLEGRELIDLVGEAESRGARHIELRQTCLGSCESGEGDDWRPSLEGLQAVVEAHPALTYDLAMAWPCLSRETDPEGRGVAGSTGRRKAGGRRRSAAQDR